MDILLLASVLGTAVLYFAAAFYRSGRVDLGRVANTLLIEYYNSGQPLTHDGMRFFVSVKYKELVALYGLPESALDAVLGLAATNFVKASKGTLGQLFS